MKTEINMGYFKIKLIVILLMISPLLFFAQSKAFFNDGTAQIAAKIDKIPLEFINDFALVKVEIGGEFYQFILDTGAPTIISSEIYNKLNLKSAAKGKVFDSENAKRKQIFTYLPEMKAGTVIFKNIGAIVIDLEEPEFKCYKIDGILGANQMAKLFWRIDFQNSSGEVTKDLSNFNLNDYNLLIPFITKPQKTPLVLGSVENKKVEFTLDTGYVGRLAIQKNAFDVNKNIAEKNRITKYGINTISAYGAGQNPETFTFKTADFKTGNIVSPVELIDVGESSLIGNQFLKNYVFVLDWKSNNIYLKESKILPIDFESFGFGYRFLKGVTKIIYVYKNADNQVQVGDEILSIDGVQMNNLDDATACSYYKNNLHKNKKEIEVKVKRKDAVFTYTIKKQNLFR